jgi:hypothetical protein
MTTEIKINSFSKQNDSIYSSLISKGIQFVRIDISSIEDIELKLKMLLEENSKLKEVVKNNKPAPVPKESNPVVQVQPKKESTRIKDEDEDEDCNEVFEEPKAKFSTITNMEELKRAFCNGEYESFESLCKTNGFKYFTANYKYSSDKDGAAEFIARNLVKGFVRNMDELKKYLFVCFRCYQNDLTNRIYSYSSMWIFNSNESLKTVLADMYDDFDFTEVSDLNQVSNFLFEFRKLNQDLETNLIDEQYLH